MMGNETADQWLLVVLVACLQLRCIDFSYVVLVACLQLRCIDLSYVVLVACLQLRCIDLSYVCGRGQKRQVDAVGRLDCMYSIKMH